MQFRIITKGSNIMTIRDHFVDFVKGANKVASEQAALQEKRVGTYTHIVLAAIEAGNTETFETACEAFADELRSNAKGIARKLGCVPAKRQPKGQPKNRPVYTIPSSFMAARSYMKSAFEYGVNVSEDEEPRAYTAIRNDVQVLKAAEAKDALTGDDAIKAELAEILEGIQSRVDNAEGDSLNALRAVILTAQTDARKAFGLDQMREQAKADKDEDETEDKPKLSKAADELAAENDIDVSTLEGTGNNGLITVNDVRNALAGDLAEAA